MIRAESEPYHLVRASIVVGDPPAGRCDFADRIMTWTPNCAKDTKRLATTLIDLSPADMQRRLGDALGIYVDAMRYPRGTEDQRASMWLEHTRRSGWKAVAAVSLDDPAEPAPDDPRDAQGIAEAPLLGVAYREYRGPQQWLRQPGI